MKKLLTVLIAVVAVVAHLGVPRFASAQQMAQPENFRFELEYRRWRPKLIADLEVGGPPIYPSTDLGLGDERTNDYRGSLRLSPRLRIRGSYLKTLKYEGTQVLSRTLTYRGVTFLAGDTVTTAVQIDQFKGGISIEFLQSRDGFLGVTVDYSRLESRPSLQSAAAGTASGPLRVSLPTVGFVGRVYLTPRLVLTAEASGMKRESQGVIAEFEGMATANINPRLGLAVGYRNFYARIAQDGRAAYRLKGPFFSVTARI